MKKDDKRTIEYDKSCLSYQKKYKKEEEWKPVILNGVTSKYVVSNYGRIMHKDTGKRPRIYMERNHFYTILKLDDGSSKRIGTYRVVAVMFLEIPKKYLDMGYTMDTLVVDHKRDGDEDNFKDNTVWNLQWLTYRENTSKAFKCGYREPFTPEFRKKLDQMILDGYDNNAIYEMAEKEYGFPKEEIKANLQVRRRRLGKTLKEHHEESPEVVQKIDELLKQGLSNSEIIAKLQLPTKGRRSTRLLQYRRTILKIPAQASKYLSNEENEILRQLLKDGYSTAEIVKYFHKDTLPQEDLKKFRSTIITRRIQYKKKQEKEEKENVTT